MGSIELILFIMLLVLNGCVWILYMKIKYLRKELEAVSHHVTETMSAQQNLNCDVTKIIGDVVLHVKEIERGE